MRNCQITTNNKDKNVRVGVCVVKV